ncbi:hypothetical protein B0H10DRAFT_2003338 [Mycena sp. CBHHK59/15]|nr:hypothetical protein B0H10DRAFT_2003338 [Mycena sp. CBHHK59/15]
MGFSQAANHTHCVFPSTQQAQLTAFVNKFLFGQVTNTNITETAGGYSFPIPNAQWAPWTPPVLVPTARGPRRHWAQCGGQGWAGATACVSPFTCTVLNQFYSQCL